MSAKKSKTPVSVSNAFEGIESLFSDYQEPPDRKKEPFTLLCLVSGRLDSPGPRDPMWEYILDVGMNKIEKVLARQPIGAGPHYFVFPDRWLTPPESADFTLALKENPDAKKFGRVYCVVHQPYIVSGCRREEVRIIRKRP